MDGIKPKDSIPLVDNCSVEDLKIKGEFSGN